MNTFRITKIVSDPELAAIVALLNAQTRDGHIVREVRVDASRWLICIECTDRKDAQCVRDFTGVA